MTSSRRPDRRRGSSFIQWSAVSASGQPPSRRPDPDFVVDRQRLRQYLSSLEGLSGE
ncbi:hypothetical protein GFS31_12480 [Leptolyngbya sp. BL0902]|uniref:hypothetical protein n=1 Tax=Leptolyngbya sp. BL0902 TaxID=1115757 RepID=UPI0018E7DD5D|nr:hypothetical protein [Leptolyngbya sp. BL0902]QQE64567.1 hypothetical protein GFS31_12480 [Leptolyngbya sp. BL0902]